MGTGLVDDWSTADRTTCHRDASHGNRGGLADCGRGSSIQRHGQCGQATVVADDQYHFVAGVVRLDEGNELL